MTILYLHQYFCVPTTPGGTRSYDLAKQFINAGHKVIVVTASSSAKNLHNNAKGWTIRDYEGIELHILPLEYSNKLSFAKRILAFVKFLVYASVRMLKIKCDVVLATSTPITIAIPAMIKKLFHKTPYVFEVRDVWPEIPIAMGVIKNKFIGKLLNDFEKGIYKRSTHIVALSDDMKRSITTRTVNNEQKLSVIPNISEITRFADYQENKEMLTGLLGFKPRKVVLYAGTLGMVNGLTYMVNLAEHAYRIDPSIKFVIFGEGMEKESLIALARQKGILNENIFFLDAVTKAQLPQIYHESTVASSFVIPTPELWANSANKFFDCLAAGRPIVINHRGWQAEVIESENVGFVLDYNVNNIPEEAKRFCAYLENESLLLAQGAKARMLAESRYSLEIASSRYLKILDNVVS